MTAPRSRVFNVCTTTLCLRDVKVDYDNDVPQDNSNLDPVRSGSLVMRWYTPPTGLVPDTPTIEEVSAYPGLPNFYIISILRCRLGSDDVCGILSSTEIG